MAKQFTVVTREYVTKNKIQKLCLTELQKVNQTLWPNIDDATKIINQAFKKAINEYTGHAKLPELKHFRPDNKTYQFYIEEVIYITIYEVKGEKLNLN